MANSNLEKFLPALIGLIGRVGAVAGGGEEEEEEQPMNKKQVEKALLKLMKSGSIIEKHYPGDEGYDIGNKQHQNAMSEAIRPYDDTHPYYDDDDDDYNYFDEEDDDRGIGVEWGRRKGKGLTNLGSIVPEDDPEFGMGELEQRIASKPRNQPTYPMRDRGTSPESQKERRGQYQGAGRPKPEVGSTPSVSASLKALNKMLRESFLSKKVDPGMAAQSRSARRQQQEGIAGKHAQDAASVNVTPDNAAQQAGQEAAGSLGWAIADTLRDRNAAKQAGSARGSGGQGSSQPSPGAPPGSVGNNDPEDAPSQQDMISAVTQLGEHVGASGAASGSGEVDTPPKPDSLGLTTNQPWESGSGNTPPGTPAAATAPGTAPGTKAAGVTTNPPDLTSKPWLKQTSK